MELSLMQMTLFDAWCKRNKQNEVKVRVFKTEFKFTLTEWQGEIIIQCQTYMSRCPKEDADKVKMIVLIRDMIYVHGRMVI